MKPTDVPTSTYRLQFSKDFGFAAATRLIPYLKRLGISHVYASPYLRARTGSPHGYDIVDHQSLNPELGDADDYRRFVETLHTHGLGQILDIVPNHMGVGGSDNDWWLDVLEHGPASDYAEYFDIDWQPAKAELQNKLLVPLLGDHYGSVLESGDLKLGFDDQTGRLHVSYFEHCFPLDPRTWPRVIGHGLIPPQDDSLDQPAAIDQLVTITAALSNLPRRTDLSRRQRQQRRDTSRALKRSLTALYRSEDQIARLIDDNVALFNGRAGEPRSFDRLHRLLESQAFRLAYWQVAADEINYRRFFDINALAGVRVEDPAVFNHTHELIGSLVRDGSVNGLRIDHPDGLSDPAKYYRDLQRYLTFGDAGAPVQPEDAVQAEDPEQTEENGEPDPKPVYVLVEKILARHEHLPADWYVHGTTGYEFAYVLNGLFVHHDGEAPLSETYREFTGNTTDFDALLYDRKKLIIRNTLSSELTVLANILARIAEADRYTRDFTFQGLRDALAEVAACFPVYRTYISDTSLSDTDRQHVQWAVTHARQQSPASDMLIYDFIEGVLLSSDTERPGRSRRRTLRFIRRLQQYTAPVMAKGMEDTAFYIFNRLVSLNDVGFDPRTFGVSPAAFHHDNRTRLQDRPYTMLSTSTHDSKRGEDVRARINVLSEIPDLWQRHLERWQRVNRSKKKLIGTVPAPSANDEYLFYQTLIGTWPTTTPAGDEMAEYRARIEGYMLKAVKEAKVNTSWINPAQEYESAISHFVHALLDEGEHNPFLADFIPFQRRLQRFGLYNALAQTLLKLTAPGVPDIFQGNELWSFSLTDPDNRRQVDYAKRESWLENLAGDSAGPDNAALARDLFGTLEDGRAKLFLTWKVLNYRQRFAGLFRDGAYLPLHCAGEHADEICAFARSDETATAIVVAPRWLARLHGLHTDAGSDAEAAPPLGSQCWGDTWVALPEAFQSLRFRNELTGAAIDTTTVDESRDLPGLRVAEVFSHFTPAFIVSD